MELSNSDRLTGNRTRDPLIMEPAPHHYYTIDRKIKLKIMNFCPKYIEQACILSFDYSVAAHVIFISLLFFNFFFLNRRSEPLCIRAVHFRRGVCDQQIWDRPMRVHLEL